MGGEAVPRRPGLRPAARSRRAGAVRASARDLARGHQRFGKPGNATAETVVAEIADASRGCARQAAIRVIGATVTPALGSTSAAHGSPEEDAKRNAFNEFIRTSGMFDGVMDFDTVARPQRQARSRNSFPTARSAARATSCIRTGPDIWRWARPSTSTCSSQAARTATSSHGTDTNGPRQ